MVERDQLKNRDNPKHPDALEDRRLHDVQLDLEESIADTPTHTAAGVAAKLRQIQRDDEVFDGMSAWRPAAFRTALEALGRNTPPTIEDRVLVLKREWDDRWQQYESAPDDDEITDPLHDRLRETEFLLHRTPATTIAGVAIKVELWTRSHCPAVETSGRYVEAPDDWWKAPLGEFGDDLDCLPIASALQDLKRMTRTTMVAEAPSAEDAALFDALAEYDRLVAIEQDLEHRTTIFRPGIPEAREADTAYEAACDESMAAWERVRNTPATTQAGLIARLQATDRFMTDLGETDLYDTDWCIIKADVQRITGETRS